ncbi:MAG: translation initiation factor IF-2 [Planctomycetes bacterium]|nr:translation initiation factor IF-2 [Planctomycetota bacterium]
MKPRAYEIAKELGMSPKDLIDRAKEHGIAIKSNLSALESDVVAQIRTVFGPGGAGAKHTSPPAAKPAAPPPAAVAPAAPAAHAPHATPHAAPHAPATPASHATAHAATHAPATPASHATAHAATHAPATPASHGTAHAATHTGKAAPAHKDKPEARPAATPTGAHHGAAPAAHAAPATTTGHAATPGATGTPAAAARPASGAGAAASTPAGAASAPRTGTGAASQAAPGGAQAAPPAPRGAVVIPAQHHPVASAPAAAASQITDARFADPETTQHRVLRPQEVERIIKDTSQDARPRHRAGYSGPNRPGRYPQRRDMRRPARSGPPAPRPLLSPTDKRVEITVPISVKDFAQAMAIKANVVIQKLMAGGTMATMNDPIAEEAIELIALELGREISIKKAYSAEAEVIQRQEKLEDKPEDLIPRAPVVTIMGHVDHGKTSLLDRIRSANVAAGEAGGITQHIGAYRILTKDGKPVVFLDTPGHEAFTKMRARGANVTDLAVLVVAADDGVMPQTEEAMNHAKAAGARIVVAMNKIDKPTAKAEHVKRQLAQLGLMSEEWGGNTTICEVSALTGVGVDHLLEMLVLEAELLELRANPKRPASGVVIEAKLSEGKGVLAHVLVQNGTLRRGDVLLCGRAFGKVRAMFDDKGSPVEEAGPSSPVEITGLSAMPDAGDRFLVTKDLSMAREVAVGRERKTRETALLERKHVTLENLFTHIDQGKAKELRVVLKCDVKGSSEVLMQSLKNIGTAEVTVRLIHSAIGGINESDVLLADASDAIIIGFNVLLEERARALSQEKGVDVRLYDVIYKIIEDVTAASEGLLEPERVEVVTGHAVVKEIFRITRIGNVAGCMVSDGKVERSNQVRLKRGAEVLWEGKLASLKRVKDDVREVLEGFECGIKLDGHDDIRKGDVIETYAVQTVARKLTR